MHAFERSDFATPESYFPRGHAVRLKTLRIHQLILSVHNSGL